MTFKRCELYIKKYGSELEFTPFEGCERFTLPDSIRQHCI